MAHTDGSARAVPTTLERSRDMMRRKMVVGAGSAAILSMLAACGGSGDGGTVRAEDEDVWSIPATFIDCDAEGVDPAGCVGPGEEDEYAALAAEDVSEPWQICVTVPHVKDPIWVASN